MATKKSKVEEPQEEVVLQPEVTETIEEVVEKQQVNVGEDGILNRDYMVYKYKK